MGGISYVAAEDSFPLAANPALAQSLSRRIDFGLDSYKASVKSTIHGNLLGPDEEYRSSAKYFFIPQFGFSNELSETVSFGSTGFVAGFGTDYKRSPYQRFGSTGRTSVTLGQAGITTALAWRLLDDQSVGAAVNLGYQQLRVRGLGPFRLFSEDPDHVTDQGKDGTPTIGFTIGWHAYVTSRLEAGAAYTSKNWAQRFSEYAGMLPEHGLLELPARYGAALAFRPFRHWTVAAEYTRLLLSNSKALGNGSEQLLTRRLGSEDGPGFGWSDQDIYKLGVMWKYSNALDLRAGFNYGTQIISSNNTLIDILGAVTVQRHYTLGATYTTRSGWEISSYLAHAPNVRVRGDGSIPLYLGGGEADVQSEQWMVGFSIGYSLD